MLVRARRRARRRLVLAARPRRPRGPRVSRSRERVHRGRARADRAAARRGSSRRSRAASRRPTSRRRSRTGRGSTTRARSRAGSTRCTAGAARGTSADGDEQVLLDENVAAEGHDYFSLGGFDVTPDHRVLAYAVDRDGGERYTLRFRDLDDGRPTSATSIEDVTYGLAWADDARTCFYVRPDDAMRPWQVWRHVLGTAGDRRRARVPGRRRTLLRVGVGRTRSRPVRAHRHARRRRRPRCGSCPTDDARRGTEVVAPRAADHEYDVEHHSTSTARRSLPHRDEQRRRARTSSSSRRRSADPGDGQLGRARAASRRRAPRSVSTAFRDHLVLQRASRGSRRGSGSPRSATAQRTRSRFPIPSTACGSARTTSTTRRRSATATRRSSRRSPTSTTTCETRTATVVKVQPVPAATTRRSTRPTRMWVDRPGRRAGTRSRSCTARTVALDGTRAGAALRLRRRTRSRSTPTFRAVATLAARPRLRVRDRARPRRRRARPRVVRGRTPRAQAEHVHRLRRVRGSTRSRPSYTSAEPARRARWERRRPADGRGRQPAARTCSPPSSPRCRSSTSSPRCSTRPCRSPSPSGRSGATRASPTRTRG